MGGPLLENSKTIEFQSEHQFVHIHLFGPCKLAPLFAIEQGPAVREEVELDDPGIVG
jgi:hypothetical protein